MIEIDKNALVTACEDHEVKVVTDYSGRFMYGKKCVGVVGNASDLMMFLTVVLPAIEGATNDHAERTTWTRGDAEWHDARQDNIGNDLIFYWPEVRAI